MGDTTNDNGHDNQTWCVPLSLLGLSTHSPKNKNEEELQLKQQDNDNNQPQEQQCRRRRRRRKNVTTITKLVQLLTLVTFVVVIILFKRCTTNSSSSSSTTLSSSSSHTVLLEDDNPYNISFLVRKDDNRNPYYMDVEHNETYDKFVQRTLERSADNMEGRMLAACVTAYGINPSSADIDDGRVFEPSEKYYKASGWLSSPTVIQHGPAHIHAALVGRTVDGVVVAFRGTLGSGRGWQSYVDYLQSDVLMYPYSIGKSLSDKIMKVYAGAYFSFEQLWSWNPFYTYWRCLLLPWNGCMIRTNNINENLMNYHNMMQDKTRKKTTKTRSSSSAHSHKNVYLRNEIARQLKIANAFEAEAAAAAADTQQPRRARPVKLYVTGHSKGGTMAIYAAMKMNQQPTYQRFFHMTEEANHTTTTSSTHIRNGTAYNYTTQTITTTKPSSSSSTSKKHSISKNPIIVENSNKNDDDEDTTSNTIPTAVYTFAAMKAGNRAFVEELSNIPIYQYENYYDIIPLLFPPSSIQMQSIQAQLNQELPADDRPLVDAALNGTSTSSRKSSKSLANNNKNDSLLNLLQMMSYISTHHPHHVLPNQNIYSSIYHKNGSNMNHKQYDDSRESSMFRRGGGLRSWVHNNDDDDEFYHAALPQNRFCMTYHKHSKTVDMQPCTYELDEIRLHDIIQNLMVPTVLEEEEKDRHDSSSSLKETNADATTTTSLLFSASSHHKPSCKGMGYMHGVCETVCT